MPTKSPPFYKKLVKMGGLYTCCAKSPHPFSAKDSTALWIVIKIDVWTLDRLKPLRIWKGWLIQRGIASVGWVRLTFWTLKHNYNVDIFWQVEVILARSYLDPKILCWKKVPGIWWNSLDLAMNHFKMDIGILVKNCETDVWILATPRFHVLGCEDSWFFFRLFFPIKFCSAKIEFLKNNNAL